MMMNNVDQYENLIVLLKQALIFYAENSNYTVKRNNNNELFSQIEMDCGSQARFALKKIEEFSNFDKMIEDSVEKYNNEEKIAGEELIKTLTNLKNLIESQNNIEE